MTSLPRRPVSSFEPGTSAYGSAARMAASNRSGSRRAAWASRPCATVSPAALVEAIGIPGADCSDRAAHTAQTAPSTATPGAERRRCRAATMVSRTADKVTTATSSARTSPTRATRTPVAAPPIEAHDADSRADVAPVQHGIEGPAELLVEPHVEDLDDRQEAERDPRHHRQATSRAGRQQQTDPDQDQPLQRDAGEAEGRDLVEPVGGDENRPDDPRRDQRGGAPHNPSAAQAGAGAV